MFRSVGINIQNAHTTRLDPQVTAHHEREVGWGKQGTTRQGQAGSSARDTPTGHRQAPTGHHESTHTPATAQHTHTTRHCEGTHTAPTYRTITRTQRTDSARPRTPPTPSPAWPNRTAYPRAHRIGAGSARIGGLNYHACSRVPTRSVGLHVGVVG